jgi:divalent metal cation (Fe/Co/Zn/Cd) transporter
MLSEGIHWSSTPATRLDALWVRIKPADAEHPFGYGKELYFGR